LFGALGIQDAGDASKMMAASMLLLSIIIVILGVCPEPIIKLINTAIKAEMLNAC